jgi:spore germination protein YaaH
MKKLILLSVSLLLVLAILAAAVPAMAAGAGCEETYGVQKGDTKASVAGVTGLSWAELARLNNLDPNGKLIAGTKLCYPAKAKAAAALTAAVAGNKVQVMSKNATDNQVYIVRARDASRTTGGWENLGFFKAYEDMTSRTSFNLPKDLKGISPMDVCFKNAESGKLTCVKVLK